MDDTVRKKLIIIISMVMSLLIIIALVLWVFLGQKDTSDDDAGFLLVYLLATLLVGLLVMIAETMIGRAPVATQ